MGKSRRPTSDAARRRFFSDLSAHSVEELLEQFYFSVPDEIHGIPYQLPYDDNSCRPEDKGGLVWELKRRLSTGDLVDVRKKRE